MTVTRSAVDLRPGDAGLEVKLQTLLAQALVQERTHFDVRHRNDPREELEDGDLGSQTSPDRAQLQPDVAGADHDEMLGDAVEAKRFGRADDRRAVEREEREADRLAAAGHQDVRGLERDFAPVVQADDDRLGRGDPRGAEDRLDPVLLEEEPDAVGQSLDDLVLPREHRRDVDRQSADLDAVAAEPVVGQVVELARIEQGLARNAADVEAGAAQGRPLLDAGDLPPELCRPDGRDVTAGTRPDHDQVITLGHAWLLESLGRVRTMHQGRPWRQDGAPRTRRRFTPRGTAARGSRCIP